MYYCFHDIDVSVVRNVLKEAPGSNLAALRQSGWSEHLICRRDDLRLVKQDSASGRTCKQDFFQQQTLTTTNIDDATKLAEVIGFEYRLGFRARVARHRAIENILLYRILHAIGPRIHPKSESGRTFPGLDAMKQIAPRPPLAGGTYPSGVVAPRTRRIGRQTNT